MQLEGQTNDAEASWTELAPILDEALDQLSDGHRHALLLRFFEGRSFAEIGQVFAISEDAAKMRVSRALEKLRTILQPRVCCTAAWVPCAPPPST